MVIPVGWCTGDLEYLVDYACITWPLKSLGRFVRYDFFLSFFVIKQFDEKGNPIVSRHHQCNILPNLSSIVARNHR